MMEPANLRNGDDPATWWGFDDSGLGTVVVERLVWPRGVVVGTVGPSESAEMGLAQDEAMIQALAAKGADDSLDKRVLPGCARGGEDLADPHPLDSSRELVAVDRVAIAQHVPLGALFRA